MNNRLDFQRTIIVICVMSLAFGCENEPGGNTTECVEAGGSCGEASSCPRGEGHVAPIECGTEEEVCCLPQGECGTADEFDCCSETTTERPLCIDGTLLCPDGTSRLRCEFDYCGDAGGACTTIGDCGPGAGHLGLENCGFPPMVCCLPEGSCNADHEFDCCSETATFRPYCIEGQLACAEGSSVEQCEEGP